MKTKQSALLTDFYRSYWNWLESRAPDMAPYSRGAGLCANSGIYIEHKLDNNFNKLLELREELSLQFAESGLCLLFPFDICPDYYNLECQKREAHLNPLRVQWVKDHLDLVNEE